MLLRSRCLAPRSRRSLLVVAVPVFVVGWHRVGPVASDTAFRAASNLPSVWSSCGSPLPYGAAARSRATPSRLRRGPALGASRSLLAHRLRGVRLAATSSGSTLLSTAGLLSVVTSTFKFAAIAYCSILTLFFAFQRKLLFIPSSNIANPTATGGQLVTLPRGEGAALFFEAKSATRPTLVFFHGNADQLGWSPAQLGRRLSQSYGVGFLAIEYPGYGVLTGQGFPSEEAIAASAELVLKHFVAERGLSQDRMVLFGHSIGCAVALELAHRGYGSRTILVSPFVSVAEIASTLYPFLRPALRLLPFLIHDKFDNGAKMPHLTMPVLVVHGQYDEIVPADHGKSLVELNENARFRLVPDMGHNDIMNTDEVLSEIVAFAKGSEAAQ